MGFSGLATTSLTAFTEGSHLVLERMGERQSRRRPPELGAEIESSKREVNGQRASRA